MCFRIWWILFSISTNLQQTRCISRPAKESLLPISTDDKLFIKSAHFRSSKLLCKYCRSLPPSQRRRNAIASDNILTFEIIYFLMLDLVPSCIADLGRLHGLQLNHKGANLYITCRRKSVHSLITFKRVEWSRYGHVTKNLQSSPAFRPADRKKECEFRGWKERQRSQSKGWVVGVGVPTLLDEFINQDALVWKKETKSC